MECIPRELIIMDDIYLLDIFRIMGMGRTAYLFTAN